jgi:hypothetical protein
LLFAFVLSLGLFSVHEPSTWVRVKVGQRILSEGVLPRVETFSYGAAGAPWTTESWLTDVLFAKLDVWGGAVLVSLFKSAVIAGGFALLLPISHGNPVLAAALLSIGAWSAWAGFAETPFAFDFLFFAVFLRLLRPRHRFRWSHAAAMVALTALWPNLHGSSAPLALWLVGLKVFKTTLRTAARERLGYWAAFIMCVLVFSWNPHGYGVFLHVFSDAASGTGWRVPLASPAGLILLAGVVSCWYTLQEEFVATFSAATVISLAVVLPGFRPLGVMAACPVIALALGHVLRPRDDTFPRVAKWTVFALALLAVYVGAITRSIAPSGGYGVPTLGGAVHFLDDNKVSGKMFNEPSLGAELIGTSSRPVFVDRRQTLYPREFLREAGDWPRLFGALDAVYGFDYAVVRNRRAAYPARILDLAADWSLAYADDRTLVYLKRQSPNTALAASAAFRRVAPNRLWPDSLDAALADPHSAALVLAELDAWQAASPDCVQALLWKAYVLTRLEQGEKADRLLDLARERPALAWDPELQAALAAVEAARGRVEAWREASERARRSARRLGDATLVAEIETHFEAFSRLAARTTSPR